MAITFPPTDDTTPDDGSVKYTDPDNGREYYWNGYAWELVCEDGGGGVSGDFLLKYGDNVDDATGEINYQWNQNVNIILDDDLSFNIVDEDEYFSIEGEGSNLYVDVYVEGFDVETTHSINLNAASNITLQGRFGEIVNRTIDDTSNLKQIANKEYVDAQDQKIQTEIVTLQEEIEAIAPTIQAGIWQDGNSATPGDGHFAMRLGNGDVTQNYEETDIQTLIISTTDKEGAVQTFDGEEVGDEIQLFDVEDQNFGLFKIDAIDNNDPNYVRFTVTHLRGLGSTHVDDDVLIRTFNPVTSGDGSAYLLKTGETINAPGTVVYKWDQPVEIESQTHLDVRTGLVELETNDFNSYCSGTQWFTGTSFRFGSSGSRKYLYLTTNEITTDLEITDTSDDKSLTTKKYVDDKFAGASGGCIELNGGKLCANGPMPDFIDLTNNGKVVRQTAGLNTRNTSSTYLSLDTERGVRYVVKDGDNRIYQVPLSAGTDWSQGVYTNLQSNYYSDAMGVNPSGEYIVLARYSPKTNGQYAYKNWYYEIARTSDWKTATRNVSPGQRTGNTASSRGNISWFSDTQFVCAVWAHGEYTSYMHHHIYGEISTDNNGDPVLTLTKKDNGPVTGIYTSTSSSDFHAIHTANNQIFMTTGQSGKIWRLKSFNKNYNDWEEVCDLTYSERPDLITYISELKRYYYTARSGKAYLSQPTEDPLSDITFNNAVVFDFPAHVFSDGSTYSGYPKISGYPPFLYGTQLIVPSSWHLSKNINGTDEWVYRGYFIYEGGDTPGTLYKGDPENQLRDGYDFNAQNHIYSPANYGMNVPDVEGFIDGTKIVTQFGYEIETDVPQPYIHDLTWNGVSVLNESFELDFHDYPPLPKA